MCKIKVEVNREEFLQEGGTEFGYLRHVAEKLQAAGIPMVGITNPYPDYSKGSLSLFEDPCSFNVIYTWLPYHEDTK